MTNLRLFPVELPSGLRASSIYTGPPKYGVPTLFGISGTSTEEPDRRVSVVVGEWPERFAGPEPRVEREKRLAGRVDLDLHFGGKQAIFGEVQEGPDPPDLISRKGDTARGVEITRLLSPQRAKAAQEFESLRAGLLRHYPRRFAALRGHIAYVSVSAQGWIPEADAVSEVLADFVPFPARFEGPMPEQLPSDFPIGRGEGFIVTAAAFQSRPDSVFYDAMGFEIALSHPSILVEDEAWDIVAQRVARKDKPGVDDLVIAAGAPTDGGFAFPSDSVLGSLALAAARTRALPQTNHIARVLLHLWTWRAVAELSPSLSGYRLLCGDRGFERSFAPEAE